MGSRSSRVSPETIKQNQIINSMLAAEKKRLATTFKILLLGPGDSGKSTIVKQMRLLHLNGFSKHEINLQQAVIASNILNSVSAIVGAMTELGIAFENPDRGSDASHIQQLNAGWNYDTTLDVGDWACLKRLWEDCGLQTCFARSNEYQLDDSTQFFCEQIDRYSSPDFVPDDQDMLRSRVSTMGIVEIEFQLQENTCKVFDVGGQRSQRKKWIHCFEDVNALMYITSLSEYNQTLFEDSHVNRMQESVILFATIFHSTWFRKSSFILFLNKKDLFEEKLKRFALSDTFPEYTGGSGYDEGASFVASLFENQESNASLAVGQVQARFKNHKGAQKQIYTQETCATDTKNIEFVLKACYNIILEVNMNRSGMA